MTPRISPEERAHWRETIIAKHDLPEGWVQNILDTKPDTVDITTGVEHMTLCDLADAGEIIIRNVIGGKQGFNSHRTFVLNYPDPEARVQTHLFDL